MYRVRAVTLFWVQKYSKGTMMPCEPIYNTERGVGAAGCRKGRAATQLQNWTSLFTKCCHVSFEEEEGTGNRLTTSIIV
jgi:hypothetical protein